MATQTQNPRAIKPHMAWYIVVAAVALVVAILLVGHRTMTKTTSAPPEFQKTQTIEEKQEDKAEQAFERNRDRSNARTPASGKSKK